MSRRTLTAILSIILVVLVGLSSCGRGNRTPVTSSNTSTQTSTSETTSLLTSLAIQVTLDYFGIKSTHQPAIYWAPNTIQLYAVVDDGKTSNKYSYPSSNEGITMSDFQLVDLREQTIFSTPSVGDYLRISVLAYSCQDKETALGTLKALETFQPGIRTLREFYQNLPQKEELIGYYEHTWYPIEKWGTVPGQYKEENENSDLVVWFRIWSNNEPQVISKPDFNPEIKITNMTLPLNAKPGLVMYSITLSLENREQLDIRVRWEAYSSIIGKFDSDTALIPKNRSLDIKKYYYWEAGNRTITYKLYYGNTLLDTRSGTLNVAP